MLRVPLNDLTAATERALLRLGLAPERAALSARLIAETDRDGVQTHGIARLPRFAEMVRLGHIDPLAQPEPTAAFGALERWAGHRGPGNLAAYDAMNRAMELAAQHGLGAVALADTTHWQRGGTFGFQAADAGLAALCWTNTLPNVPAWGTAAPTIGNNPLVLAIPHLAATNTDSNAGNNPDNNVGAPGPSPLGTWVSAPPTSMGAPPPTSMGAPPPTSMGAAPPTSMGAPPPTSMGAPPPTSMGALPPTSMGAPPPTSMGAPLIAQPLARWVGPATISAPIVLDMAMSQYSYGTLTKYRERGEQLPFPGGYDATGELTCDPAAIERSQRALPIGLWKGSGLAFALDVLAAMLSGGRATHDFSLDPLLEVGQSQIFLAIAPTTVASASAAAPDDPNRSASTPFDDLNRIVSDAIAALHAAPPLDPRHPVRYPGEGALAARAESLRLGVAVDEQHWAAVLQLAS